MTNTELGELYFIAAMMVLITILCVVSVYIFFRQLKREKSERAKFTNPKKEKKADEID
jgi:cytochrome bd-type quinol oxidase subunit 1